MDRHLLVISGIDRGRILPVEESDFFAIGHAASVALEYRLRDPTVARVHCEIEAEEGIVIVTDNSTPAGTFVNGTRVSRSELHDNDVIRIGATELRYFSGEDAPKTLLSVPSLTALTSPADLVADLTDRTLASFQVGPVIGTGRTGWVFRAHDTKHGHAIALKVLRPDFFKEATDVQRFVEALKPVLALRHPNLVTLRRIGRTVPYGWLATELLDGKSATQVLRRMASAGLLAWRQTLRIAIQVGRALAVAHGRGLVHGRLTPQDVLQTGQGVKLNSLGLGQALGMDLTLPIDGVTAEEAAYAAPEQTHPGAEVDGRADVYRLGAITYALLTGRPPFDADELPAMLTHVRRAPPVRPKKLQPYLPVPLEQAVLQALAKRPEARFPSIAAFVLALEAVAQEQEVTV